MLTPVTQWYMNVTVSMDDGSNRARLCTGKRNRRGRGLLTAVSFASLAALAFSNFCSSVLHVLAMVSAIFPSEGDVDMLPRIVCLSQSWAPSSIATTASSSL